MLYGRKILYIIFLFQTEGEDELKKRQLMELAIINGTYRDSTGKNNSKLKFKFINVLLYL